MTSRKQVPMDGTLSGAISGEVSSLLQRYTGREPTQARTFVHDDLIVCLLGDTVTEAEQSMLTGGDYASLLDTRSLFQHTMRADLTEAVERLSGRRVIAFMSQTHIDPDFGVEAFVLEPVAALPNAPDRAYPPAA